MLFVVCFFSWGNASHVMEELGVAAEEPRAEIAVQRFFLNCAVLVVLCFYASHDFGSPTNSSKGDLWLSLRSGCQLHSGSGRFNIDIRRHFVHFWGSTVCAKQLYVQRC